MWKQTKSLFNFDMWKWWAPSSWVLHILQLVQTRNYKSMTNSVVIIESECDKYMDKCQCCREQKGGMKSGSVLEVKEICCSVINVIQMMVRSLKWLTQYKQWWRKYTPHWHLSISTTTVGIMHLCPSKSGEEENYWSKSHVDTIDIDTINLNLFYIWEWAMQMYSILQLSFKSI